MLTHVKKISEYLRRLASRRQTVRKSAAAPRLEVEILEDRTVLTSAGVITGSFVNAQVVGAAVTLQSTSGPTTPVTLMSFTDANSSFTFAGLPAGTYQISTAPFAGLDMVGTLSVGSVSTIAEGTLVASVTVGGGQTVVENIVLNGGYAPDSASIQSFLTSFAVTPGDGDPNNTPVVSAAIGNQSLSTTNTSMVIDLAGHFADPAATNSQVTFNITNGGGTPQTLTLNLFDAQAPQTVANFLDYVNSKEYANPSTNTSDVFSRLITKGVASSAISVLQGGGVTLNPAGNALTLTEASPPTIPNEFSSANLNTAGTIAMAEGSTANSAGDQFFFNTIDNPSLDAPGSNGQAFTVFGKLADAASTTALTALAATPTQSETSTALTAALPGVDLGNIPLTGYTNATPTNLFPTDATASNFMVINSIVLTKQNDFLTYSITNDNPTLVTATLLPNHNEQLSLTLGTGTGTANIVVTATDRFGASTSQSFTVRV